MQQDTFIVIKLKGRHYANSFNMGISREIAFKITDDEEAPMEPKKITIYYKIHSVFDSVGASFSKSDFPGGIRADLHFAPILRIFDITDE